MYLVDFWNTSKLSIQTLSDPKTSKLFNSSRSTTDGDQFPGVKLTVSGSHERFGVPLQTKTAVF